MAILVIIVIIIGVVKKASKCSYFHFGDVSAYVNILICIVTYQKYTKMKIHLVQFWEIQKYIQCAYEKITCKQMENFVLLFLNTSSFVEIYNKKEGIWCINS